MYICVLKFTYFLGVSFSKALLISSVNKSNAALVPDRSRGSFSLGPKIDGKRSG